LLSCNEKRFNVDVTVSNKSRDLVVSLSGYSAANCSVFLKWHQHPW
jgi:hypothetical protein